jgi:hypothetical protein
MKLDISPFFIEQVLRNEPVPDHLLDRIEEKVGPIRFRRHGFDSSNLTDLRRPRPIHERESKSEISLKDFVGKCGGLLTASLQLGVSTSTIKKIVSGIPVSGPTIKKLLRALKAADCSMTSASLSAPLPKQHRHFAISELPEESNDQRGIYPSTIRKLECGLPISNASQRKLGILSTKDATISPLSNIRVNMVSALTPKLREIVKSDIDMFVLASKWGITETSLRKLHEGKPVTTALVKKVDAALQRHNPDDPSSGSSAAIERLRTLNGLYNQLGTLEAVGKQVGLTRERVRQLLSKGKKMGLFEYSPREYPYVSKEKIIEDYKNTRGINRVARLNNIPLAYLKKLLTAYSITEQQLADHRLEGKRAKCIEQYRQLVDKAGHHLTTTELQGTSGGHSLHNRINRLWGTIDNFRETLNIPKPPQGSPSFREDTRQWREHRQRVALVSRMQQLDQIREYLGSYGPSRTAEIMEGCGLSQQRTLKLLGLLIGAGEVERIGQGAAIRYLLARK